MTVRARPADTRKKTADSKDSDPLQLVNPGTTAVTYDLEGHNLGGGERVDCPEPDRVAMTAIERGYLRAQRGEDWLVVRDGELVSEDDGAGEPADDPASGEGSAAAPPVGASGTSQPRTEG